ncbi:MAG: hypothetical protein HY774_05430 [Acidobacteria bacterium]|nr:hypothetical protein [Acidobacteriota bacterium]
MRFIVIGILMYALTAPVFGFTGPAPAPSHLVAASWYEIISPSRRWDNKSLARDEARRRRHDLYETFVKLRQTSEELAKLLDQNITYAERQKAAKKASKIATVARKTWNELQFNDPVYQHPGDNLSLSSRGLAVAQKERNRVALQVRRTENTLASMQRMIVDHNQYLSMALQQLEALEQIARQIEVDVK